MKRFPRIQRLYGIAQCLVAVRWFWNWITYWGRFGLSFASIHNPCKKIRSDPVLGNVPIAGDKGRLSWVRQREQQRILAELSVVGWISLGSYGNVGTRYWLELPPCEMNSSGAGIRQGLCVACGRNTLTLGPAWRAFAEVLLSEDAATQDPDGGSCLQSGCSCQYNIPDALSAVWLQLSVQHSWRIVSNLAAVVSTTSVTHYLQSGCNCQYSIHDAVCSLAAVVSTTSMTLYLQSGCNCQYNIRDALSAVWL
jgi:hypothetical protein